MCAIGMLRGFVSSDITDIALHQHAVGALFKYLEDNGIALNAVRTPVAMKQYKNRFAWISLNFFM